MCGRSRRPDAAPPGRARLRQSAAPHRSYFARATRTVSCGLPRGFIGVGSTTTPATGGLDRRALSGWSPNSGTTTSGRPAASAPSVVPNPPWVTTTLAWPNTSACGTQRSTCSVWRRRAERVDVELAVPSVISTRAGSSAAAASMPPKSAPAIGMSPATRAEADVDERPRVAVPPVRQRLALRRLGGVAEAVDVRRPVGLGVLQRGGERGQVGRAPDRLGDAGVLLLEPRARRSRARPPRGRPSETPAERGARRPLGRDRRRELGLLADHDVRLPLLARRRAAPGSIARTLSRPKISPTTICVRLLGRDLRDPAPGGVELVLGRLLALPEAGSRRARPSRRARRAGDHHLVPAAQRGLDERDERVEVPDSARGGEQDAHRLGRRGISCTAQLLPSGSLKKTNEPQGEVLDLADLDAAPGQLGARGVDVRRPRAAGPAREPGSISVRRRRSRSSTPTPAGSAARSAARR